METNENIYNKNEAINLVKNILDNLPKCENMIGNKGQEIKNQFEIRGQINGVFYVLFQSYKSPIAMIIKNRTFIFSDWDYSKTTGKYRNMFLGETKAETLKKLKSGEYIAVDFEVTK